MAWLTSLLSGFAATSGWRDIATAPFDREIELAAVVDGEVGVLSSSYFRHGDTWLNAETLKPVAVVATHWRFRRPAILPVSCC
jgi:hypothetical protein